jgi:hypothetical protein
LRFILFAEATISSAVLISLKQSILFVTVRASLCRSLRRA